MALLRKILLMMLCTGTALAADGPRTVAEAALSAWASADGRKLETIVHPELMKRFREARIINFYVGNNENKKKTVASGSDAEVIAVLCEAIRAIIPPRSNQLEYFDRYVDTKLKNDLAIVSFESGYKRKSDGQIGLINKNEVVLKKDGANWKFLWSISIQIHVDLEWNPTD
jgi:hypothetical protein